MEDAQVQPDQLARFQEPLPHPGEILLEDFMRPYGLSPLALSRRMGLRDRTRIERLSRSQTAVTPDTAIRLGRVFGTGPDFWMNLQIQHDITRLWLHNAAEFARVEPIAPDMLPLADPA